MELSINVKGDAELKRQLAELARLYPDYLGAALYQEGMVLWRDAVKRAPVEFGVLRTSAYVSPPMRNSGGRVYVEVGFGTKYAIYQHEEDGLNHPRGGEAGYLKNAANALMSGYLQRLAKRTIDNVRAGVRAPAVQAPTQPRAQTARRSRAAQRLRKARR